MLFCLSWQIWDLASGKLKLSLTGHISTVRGVAVSSRSPYLFSCGEDKQVKCWDLEYNKVRLDVSVLRWLILIVLINNVINLINNLVCSQFPLLKTWFLVSSFCVLGHQALPRPPQRCVWLRFTSNYRCAGDVQQRRHSQGEFSPQGCWFMFPVKCDVMRSWTKSIWFLLSGQVWDIRTKANAHTLTGHTNTVATVRCQAAEPQIITGNLGVSVWTNIFDCCSSRSNFEVT